MEKKHVNLIAKTFMTFAIVFVIALVGKLPADAATAPTQKPSNVKEVAANETAFALQWNAVAGADEYEVKVATSKTGSYISLGYVKSNSAIVNRSTLSSIKAGSSYWVKVAAVVADGNQSLAGPASDPIEAVTSPAKVTNLKHTNSGTNSISVSWSATGANTYRVYYSKTTATSYGNPKTTTNKNYTIKSLSKNTEYDVAVLAGRKSSSGYTAWATDITEKYDVPVKPSKVSIKQVYYPYSAYSSSYSRINRVNVRCSGIESADGYQYEVWKAGSGKSTKIKSVTTNGVNTYAKDISANKIKDNRFIKIRVRAYCKNSKGEKKYGAWSDWKYTCQQPMLNKSKTKSTSSGIKVAWKKVEGANRYVVYVSTKQQSGYKKVGTTTKDNMTIKKCGDSKLKSGKKYYFYIVAQKKVSGKYKSGDDAYCWSMTYWK